MKKKLLIISTIIIIVLIVLYLLGYKKAMTKEKKKLIDLNILKPIIEKDNNYLLMSKYYNLETTIKNKQIKIVFKNDEHQGTLKGILDSYILSFEINNNDDNALNKALLINVIVDALGQVNGNKPYYVSSMLSNYDLKKVTLDKDGIELISNSNSNIYKFKTNMKFKLGSIKNNYYKVKDLEEYKDTLNGEGFFHTNKGNIIIYKDMDYQKKCIIYIGELNELTSRTYNSLLSIIEIMYGNEYKDTFKSNYPELTSSVVLDKFDIIVDYQAGDDEVIKKITTDNYKILKITINN